MNSTIREDSNSLLTARKPLDLISESFKKFTLRRVPVDFALVVSLIRPDMSRMPKRYFQFCLNRFCSLLLEPRGKESWYHPPWCRSSLWLSSSDPVFKPWRRRRGHPHPVFPMLRLRVRAKSLPASETRHVPNVSRVGWRIPRTPIVRRGILR